VGQRVASGLAVCYLSASYGLAISQPWLAMGWQGALVGASQGLVSDGQLARMSPYHTCRWLVGYHTPAGGWRSQPAVQGEVLG